MESMGPHCSRSGVSDEHRDDDNSDDEDDDVWMPMSHSAAMHYADRTELTDAWQFDVPYSDNWGEVMREKLCDMGASLMDFRQFVTAIDCQGVKVNFRTWTPVPERFPLTFSAPALTDRGPSQTRSDAYREMLGVTTSNRQDRPNTARLTSAAARIGHALTSIRVRTT